MTMRGSPPDQRRRHIGAALVALQFFWIVVLAVAALLSGERLISFWPAWLLFAAGIALMCWAVTVNRPGNFNIRPVPCPDGQLITGGPYRRVRHPMYSAVILCGIGAALASGSGPSWGALAALVVVLWLKASFEERWMAEAHPGYADYQARTHRFVPGMF